MFAHIKTQTENPAVSDSDFVVNSTMHLDINFHELRFARGSLYIESPGWITKKRAVINPKNEKDEECFKWVVLAALHHEEIASHPEKIAKLEYYEDRYKWDGLDFCW